MNSYIEDHGLIQLKPQKLIKAKNIVTALVNLGKILISFKTNV